MIASLEDDIAVHQGKRISQLLRERTRDDQRGAAWLRSRMMRHWQRKVQRRHARYRQQLMKADERLGRALAFSGRAE
jgi:preprotein translocase subunit SecA